MFGEFFKFDLRYQLRTPLLWIGIAVFMLIAVLIARSDAVQLGGAIGNVHRNAPMVIVGWLNMFTVLGLLIAAAYIGNSVLRDFEFGTSELFFASPMKKRDYLFGRFAAGVVASLSIYLAICLALMAAYATPGLDAARLGPFSLAPYGWGLGVIVLPNLIFSAALIVFLAATMRSLMGTYIGIIAALMLLEIAGIIVSDVDNRWVAALVDPFAQSAIDYATRYWSAAERNTMLPALDGPLLLNRALVLAISGALLFATYKLFKPQRAGTGRAWFKRTNTIAVEAPRAGARITTSAGTPERFAAQWRAFTSTLRFELSQVLRGAPFLVLLFFGMFNLGFGLYFGEERYGVTVHPVTHLMLTAMYGSFNFLLGLIIAFYAGEMVFRERDAKIDAVVDATPQRDWVPLLAKFVALIGVIFAFLLVGAAMCVVFQLAKGGVAIEPLLYAKGLLLAAIPFVLAAAFCVALQVLTNNKFLGYLLVMVWLASRLGMGALHFDHNLYNYSAASGAPYSDLNGYGHFLFGHLSFRAYWALFAATLLAASAALWVRGTPESKTRWSEARRRLRGPLGAALALFVAGFVGLGGYVFYNTNVLNEYVASDTVLDRRADAEKAYAKYKDVPQPRITAVRADVDLYPEERRVEIAGHYKLVNKHDKPIEDLHVTLNPTTELVAVERPAMKLTLEDKVAGYRIYKLAQPLAPGDEVDFDFKTRVAHRGFTNSGEADSFVYNGTFFNSAEVMPGLGYNERAQIDNRNERRKRGLGDVPRMPKLEDEAARANSYLGHDADWIDFETTISTSAKQVALAPGYLQREWTENGRRHFHYKMDVPMMNFYAWLSADWAVKRDKWNDVAIEVYYNPAHAYNVDRMIESTKKSLDYFTKNFSPYQHHQVRIIEFPRYQTFAQSFANTIPFSESIGFIADLHDPDSFDFPFYVTAHEVAHQWWAHQVIGADLQGSTMLSESLAQYSALMVQEHEYGSAHMRQFLKYELDNYLKSRGGEVVEEVPLYRVENQPYIHYRKGAMTFYRLKDEIGEQALNRALAKFLKDRAYGAAPYPTSKELLDYVRAEAPADKQTLITDLFEKISFYDNRVVDATAKKRDDGKYDVTLTLAAKKRYADGQGNETAATLDDDIDVGVFARKPGAKEKDETVLFLEKRRLSDENPVVTVTVDAEPYEAGIDPYNKLIDRVSADNRKKVSII